MKRESSWRGLVLVGFLSLLLTTVSLQHALGSGQKEPSKDVKEEEAGRPVTPRLNAPADLTILSKAVLAAEDLMQQGLYSEAASELAAAQVPEDEQAYAVWLHALSLFRASNIDDALTLCLEAMARWGGNPWIHKIRYLAAQIYIQKRDFTKAEEIYADAARRLLAEGRKEDIARIYIPPTH